MPPLRPAPPALAPAKREEMRGIIFHIYCCFYGDEHNQDVCPLLACAWPMNSLADFNITYMAQGDTQHQGAGGACPTNNNYAIDGSGLELSPGQEKAGLITMWLPWGIPVETLHLSLC